MRESSTKRVASLHGKSIILSTSIPNKNRDSKYRRVAEAHLHIEEAVISLARAVLVADGQLVFGGHPSIAHLISQVAAEYALPFAKERSGNKAGIIIYQSRVFEDVVPEATKTMFKSGYAEIRWVEPAEGEKWSSGSVPGDPAYPIESLNRMRVKMITDTAPCALVCIGGMEGVEQEARLFHELQTDAPVFVIASTGGAASVLKEQANFIRAIDLTIMDGLVCRQSEVGHDKACSGYDAWTVPYPLIMQVIVRELAQRGDTQDWQHVED